MFCIPTQWQDSGQQGIQPPRVWQATRLCKLLMMVQYKRVRIWQQYQCFVLRSFLTGKLFRNVTLRISATGLISSLSLLWKYMEVHSNAWLMFLLNLWISFEYTSNMTGWMSMTNKKDQQIKKQAQELCLRSSKMFEIVWHDNDKPCSKSAVGIQQYGWWSKFYWSIHWGCSY